MGGELSKERKEELDAEYEEKMKADITEQENILMDWVRDINQRRQQEYQLAVQSKEREVQAESAKNMALIEEALEKLEDLKLKNQGNLEQWASNLADQAREKKQELKEEGDLQVERKLAELNQKQDELARLQDELKQKQDKFLESVTNDNENRKKLQKDHDEVTEQMTEKHREDLLKLKAELGDFKTEQRRDLKKLRQEEAEKNLEMLNEHNGLNEKRLNDVLHIVKAVEGDDKNLEIKTELDTIFMYKGRFSSAYNDYEKVMRRAMFAMEQGEELKQTPDNEDAMKELDKFCSQTESLHQNLPKEYQFLTETFCGIKTKKREIGDAMEEIQNSVDKYKKALKRASAQPALLVNLESPIKKQFEELRKLVDDLDELVLKFNIDPSNHLHEAIEDSMKASSSSSTLPQVTNGSN